LFRSGGVEHVRDVGVRGAQTGGDLLVLGDHPFGAGLSEHGRDHRVDWLRVGRSELLSDVTGEVDPAALPAGAGQDRGHRGLDPGMGIRDHQGDTFRVVQGRDFQTAFAQAAQELGPEIDRFRIADAHAEDLSATFDGYTGGDDDGLGHDASSVADVDVGRIDVYVGEPGVVQSAV